MFKKLVVMISEIENREQFDAACGAVDMGFQKERISWKEHEILYTLLGKIDAKIYAR